MKLTDEAIVSALLTCGTNKEAAEKLGISEAGLYKRLRQKSFCQLYNEINVQIMARTADSVRAKMLSALETVYQIMNDEELPPQTRLNAANSILRNCANIIQLSNQAQSRAETADIFEFL